MADPRLLELWARVLRHLAASRYYLPEHLATDEARVVEAQFREFLHHNELGLALEEAEALGILTNAPREFWAELLLAAQIMGQGEIAARCSQRSAIC